MRLVVLDTETTGLSVEKGHRVVEIGCVELVERRPSGRHFQRYLNPDRSMDAGASEVTGLTDEFLSDKPRFAEVLGPFVEFVRGAELIIHNAAFDVGFLNAELVRAGWPERLDQMCQVTDTLAMARERYPGQRNSLDALCKRLDVNNQHRTLHGALLDAEILAEVYLAMTSGQGALELAAPMADRSRQPKVGQGIRSTRPLRIEKADEAELERHAMQLAAMRRAGACLWPEADDRFHDGQAVA
ncbi:DNA polymerase III subunit epsilon [Pseudomarimonas salicorniae]|uniref:DNA polymerase III subunit epsilon n=1 Tax=Pseudomarimonas salicorniae TaxID=2933270 RepID=A0ABT0GLZ4_9GAMM|nr:DNA polymerase III subunit epsilon [Lysobacter sp. CAU 1642]MCK7595567.1 DNA polymerase III subunit epsilon [Lysobacter sp. CAU 1642]